MHVRQDIQLVLRSLREFVNQVDRGLDWCQQWPYQLKQPNDTGLGQPGPTYRVNYGLLLTDRSTIKF